MDTNRQQICADAFVPTKDTSKAQLFYEGVLGLRFISDDPHRLNQ